MADLAQDAIRNPDTAHEKTDAPRWVIALVLGIVAGGIALVIGLVLLSFPSSLRDRPRAPTVDMPEPRLQSSPRNDLRTYREEAMRRLTGYGWIDKDKGIVHIPIDEAMHRIAERGIPDWPKAAP